MKALIIIIAIFFFVYILFMILGIYCGLILGSKADESIEKMFQEEENKAKGKKS